MNRKLIGGAFAIIIAATAGFIALRDDDKGKPSVYTVKIVREMTHDTDAFTQGLVVHDGRLFESTGQYGESDLRELQPESGDVLRLQPVDDSVFAEGIAVVDNEIIMLTWRTRSALTFDLESFEQKSERTFPGEGWGLTFDGTHLIASDGSAILKVLDPETLKVVRRIEVKDGKKQITDLNELEYYKGELLANIWHSTQIARISLDDGQVTGWIELADIFPNEILGDSEAVANGIAWLPESDRLIVTGKNWPKMFEVEIVDAEADK